MSVPGLVAVAFCAGLLVGVAVMAIAVARMGRPIEVGPYLAPRKDVP